MAPPRIIYEGDETAAHQHLPVAQNLLHKVRTMAAASGAGVTGLSLSPDPDSFIYALKIGDTEVLHVFSAPHSSYEPATSETQALPDILSGVTRDGRMTTRVDKDGNSVGTLDSFKPAAETSKKYERSGFGQWDRLAVRPHTGVATSVFNWVSQYRVVFASSYSGRMCKLVQVLLGFGRLPEHQIVGSPFEIQERIAKGMQVQYDCRWHRCHILSIGADGRQWLVEISMSRGVVAMRLPLYDKKPSQGTEAMKAIVEEFGGLPTGHNFSSGKLFDKVLAAGDIVQLLSTEEMKAFYRLQPYSTAMGWTTNSKGDEAHNTGFYFGEDGIRRSAHYRLSIRIGALKKTREPGEPIADAEAVLSLVSDGRFYHPSEKYPPPIKFWEPLIDGLLSVEMRATTPTGGSNPNVSVRAMPLCDVTMHVAYVADQLKLIKYFWDRTNSETKNKVTTNYEECMYIGSWFREEVTPDPEFIPTFYTTDFDHRGQSTSVTYRTDTVGTDLDRWEYHWGVDTFRWVPPQWGTLWRTRSFRMKTVSTITGGNLTSAAVVAPHGLRDGYVYTVHRSRGAAHTTRSTGYKTLQDPIAYEIYQYVYDDYKPRDDGCWLKFGYKVRRELAPSRTGCNEMIESGSWRYPCDNGEPKQGPGVPKGTLVITVEDGTHSIEPYLVTGTEDGTISLRKRSGSNFFECGWEAWRSRSPDTEQSGVVQQYDVALSVMGEPHITYFNQLNGEQLRKGPLVAAEPAGEYNFIGVP